MSVRAIRSLPVLAALAGLVLVACDRPAEAPGDTEAPRATSPVTATPAPSRDPAALADDGVDAIRVVDRAPVAAAGDGFDVRAFAGTFGNDGMRLDVAADGTYVLAAGADGAPASTGTWTVEDDGARIRLDPDSKDEGDRVFAVASLDALVADDGGPALRRVGD